MQNDADTFFSLSEKRGRIEQSERDREREREGPSHTETCLVDGMCRPWRPLLECQSVPVEQSNTRAEPRASEASAGTAGAAPGRDIRKRSHNGWSIKREREREREIFFHGRGGGGGGGGGGGMGCRNKETGIDLAASNAGLVVGDYRKSPVCCPSEKGKGKASPRVGDRERERERETERERERERDEH